MSERVLSDRQLNRTLLERQLLLRRHDVPVGKAVERLGALQAQWTPSPYIALWTRLEGFRRDALTRALKRRSLVKATLMRHTLHMVTASDYVRFAAALRDSRRIWLERQIGEFEAAAVTERLLEELGDRPRLRQEYFGAMGEDVRGEDGPRDWIVWAAVQIHGDLLHAPPSGIWGYWGSPHYVPARTWLRVQPPVVEQAQRHLIRRYLSAFGPASAGDLASWIGQRSAGLRGALAVAEPELRRFRDESGRLLLDVRRAPIASGEEDAPIRFLPKWDSSLLAYEPRQRWRILPEPFRATVIKVNGDVSPTVLVDGHVAATWSVERGRLQIDPLRRLSRSERSAIDDEGERLVEFLSD